MIVLAKADFEKCVLYKLYQEANGTGNPLALHDIVKTFSVTVPPQRVRLALEELEEDNRISSQQANNWSLYRITNWGLVMIEASLRQATSVLAEFARYGDGYLVGQEAMAIPASDRLVALNHNEPEYLAVDRELENAGVAVRSINIAPGQEGARANVLAALDGAKELWRSTELTYLQIKVGVLLAAEKAYEFAQDTVQQVKIALLVEAVKTFIIMKLGSGPN